MGITEFCGCGKCLVGVIRLSRVTDSTNSPEKQTKQVSQAIEAVGGHLIGWADDLEVSGATDPLTRPKLGPWLRGEKGPYSGIVGAAVDRIGRNVQDVLNTGFMIHRTGRLLVTYGHDGPWNLDDTNDETMFMFQALGAQMELRAIQKRNRDETKRARDAGEPKQKNSYGFRFVRLTPTGKVHHVEIDPIAAAVIRDVAERILSDESGTVTYATEAARLTRAAVPSPSDHRALMYGREPQGHPWTPLTVKGILTSEAALGYLMHDGRAVTGPDGHPRRMCEGLWDRATHDALVKACAPKYAGSRAPRGVRLLSGRTQCGTCGAPLYLSGRPMQYRCTARVRGLPSSAHCKPSPGMLVTKLDAAVTDWFLSEFGPKPLMRRVFDPGTGHGPRMAELEADRRRLREDRSAGLYDSADDQEWYRREYARMGAELVLLRAQPERPAAMVWELTGQNVADQWNAAEDTRARRDMLANYGVKVVLNPSGARARMWIHALAPDVEADALEQAAIWAEEEADTREDARELADQERDTLDYARELADAEQEAGPDRAEWDRLTAMDDDARDAVARQAAQESDLDSQELTWLPAPGHPQDADDREPEYA
ncbi:MAG: recombinase family protein [Actinocrinis sp.]